jgi:hypothetical protein
MAAVVVEEGRPAPDFTLTSDAGDARVFKYGGEQEAKGESQ